MCHQTEAWLHGVHVVVVRTSSILSKAVGVYCNSREGKACERWQGNSWGWYLLAVCNARTF